MLKKILAAVMASLMLATVLAGCGKTATEGNSSGGAGGEKVSTAEKVNLVWYIVGAEQADLKLVNDEMNKIIEPAINATVEMRQLDWGAYDQKMNTSIATGEEFDLCWTAPQFNDYYKNIARNGFVPITDLLKTYAPETFKAVPENIWEATRVKGDIYGVINYQMFATSYGLITQVDNIDKLGMKEEDFKSYKDLDPLLKYIKENRPDQPTAFGYNKDGEPFSGALPMFGFDPLGDTKMPGVVKYNDKDMKVINQYDTPEFKEFIEKMREWYKAGYIRSDAATYADFATDNTAKKIGAVVPAYLLLNTQGLKDAGLYGQDTTVPLEYYVQFTPCYTGTERAIATMTAISKTSKNPERAMMLIELINTNEDLYNLICLGIEGKHYTKLETPVKRLTGEFTTVEPIKGGGYEPNTHWMFGNTEALWLSKGDSDVSTWKKANEDSVLSPTLGFNFDAANISTEMAQCSSVVTEYLVQLTSGSVDIDKVYPEFLAKLKTAGAEKIVAEKQTQLDAWKATKK